MAQRMSTEMEMPLAQMPTAAVICTDISTEVEVLHTILQMLQVAIHLPPTTVHQDLTQQRQQ